MAVPGTLIEYFQSKRLVCALCLKSDNKDNLFVRTEDNREDKVAKAKVVFSWPSFANDVNSDAVVSALKMASGRREEVASEVQLSELWELLVDEGGEGQSLQEMAGLYFSSPATAEQTSGLFRALENDRIYFTRKGQSYLTRTRPMVEESLQRLRTESERGQEKELVAKWLRGVWDGNLSSSEAVSEKTRNRYLTWIRELAVLGPEAPRFKEMQALFKELEIGGKDAAFRFLVKSGQWTEDEFLLLHRYHPPDAFSATLLLEAEQAAARLPELLADREDLSHLEAITIDDSDTTEIDDGLSLEELPDGWRVGIHIADASAFVEPGTPLDREAAERGTNIYLPERKFRMLPETLGDGACSLVAGEDRLSFSFLVTLDRQYQIVEQRMAPTRIRVRQRLTFDEADAALAADPPPAWRPLVEICEALRARRASDGAVTLPFPRVLVKVTPGPEINIVRETPNAPSQLIVSELMILANRTAGASCVEHGLAAFFRSQPAPEKPIPTDEAFTPEVLFRLRRLFKRGEMGLEPARHSGLGIDAYIQATSPIRRYADLVAQRQLKSMLRGGEGLYSKEELEPILHNIERTASQAEHLERERRQFWILRYLEGQRHRELDAVVLQNLPDKHIVQIVPVLYETECPHVPGRPLPPGTRLKVRIELVWPREHVVRVSPVLDDDEE